MGQAALASAPKGELHPQFAPLALQDLKAVKATVRVLEDSRPGDDVGYMVGRQTFSKLFPRASFELWDTHSIDEVDSLKVFASMFVCCKATLSDKVAALFRLFDLEEAGTMSEQVQFSMREIARVPVVNMRC